MGRVISVLSIGVFLALTRPFTVQAVSAETVGGYLVATREQVADGVVRQVLIGSGQHIQEGQISRTAIARLRVVEAATTDHVDTVSHLCGSCGAAVNTDFFGHGQYNPMAPVGAVVSDGRLLYTPQFANWPQLNILDSGRLTTGALAWSAQLATPDGRAYPVNEVNVRRAAPGDLAVYSLPWWNANTSSRELNPGSTDIAELVLRPTDPASALHVNQDTAATVVGLGGWDTSIPPGALVLSGGNIRAADLRAVWQAYHGRTVKLRVAAQPGLVQSVGFNPLILHNGRPTGANPPDCPHSCANPQTFFGWRSNPDGTVAQLHLGTVDGRQGNVSRGLTAAQVANFLKSQGDTEGGLFDSGGSSQYAQRGRVMNVPSDVRLSNGAVAKQAGPGQTAVAHVERRVVNALVVGAGFQAAVMAAPPPLSSATSPTPPASAPAWTPTPAPSVVAQPQPQSQPPHPVQPAVSPVPVSLPLQPVAVRPADDGWMSARVKTIAIVVLVALALAVGGGRFLARR